VELGQGLDGAFKDLASGTNVTYDGNIVTAQTGSCLLQRPSDILLKLICPRKYFFNYDTK